MVTVEKYVNEMNGYLRAVSDLNDQVGFRHGYFADYAIGSTDTIGVIRYKLGDAAADNLVESNLRSEGALIRSFALRNAAGAEQMDAASRRPGLSETILWRVQEYLSFEDYCGEEIDGRWITHFVERGFSHQAIVIATTRYVVWAVFSTKDERHLLELRC
ncbi:hypothetical protein [Pseudomonas sp. GV071]|uniref:hypothetical protein n=1 Tax=Pseudomonas sp. GV071 TaxID=2135754 RepID=UPI000D41F6DF|nr:hypothetical protein [Pseudomonas sp. GV071]PTQ68185.1 hypothetical protein C8K61_112102 [Pseudomonas sp. GV071]